MTGQNLAELVGPNLLHLRRYARALTGSQNRGDGLAAQTLENLMQAPGTFPDGQNPKVALFKVFHSIWADQRQTNDAGDTDRERQAQKHMAALTSDTREALLMHTIEDLSVTDVGYVLDMTVPQAANLIDTAYSEISASVAGKVLVIEDEAVIYVDLEEIVSSMGHIVSGIARTEDAAVGMAKTDKPDLIMSDIHLADDSSGIDAVNKIVSNYPDTPVIVITAFPERLLTGETKEPAFLITKPYEEHQVRSALSQAMFFSSVSPLEN